MENIVIKDASGAVYVAQSFVASLLYGVKVLGRIAYLYPSDVQHVLDTLPPVVAQLIGEEVEKYNCAMVSLSPDVRKLIEAQEAMLSRQPHG